MRYPPGSSAESSGFSLPTSCSVLVATCRASSSRTSCVSSSSACRSMYCWPCRAIQISRARLTEISVTPEASSQGCSGLRWVRSAAPPRARGKSAAAESPSLRGSRVAGAASRTCSGSARAFIRAFLSSREHQLRLFPLGGLQPAEIQVAVEEYLDPLALAHGGGRRNVHVRLQHPVGRAGETLLHFAAIGVGRVELGFGTDPVSAGPGADDAEQRGHSENLREVIIRFALQSRAPERVGDARIQGDFGSVGTDQPVPDREYPHLPLADGGVVDAVQARPGRDQRVGPLFSVKRA